MGIEIGFAAGAIILLVALVYGVRQYESRDRANERLTDAATRANYAED